MNEPTMKEIAEALNKAANLFRAFAFTNINKQQKNLLLDDLRNFIVLAAQVEAMGETNAQWRAELDKVMPPDFKDWWENSQQELPLVASLVIRNLRERAELAESQLEALGDDRELLTIAYMSGHDNGKKRKDAAIKELVEALEKLTTIPLCSGKGGVGTWLNYDEIVSIRDLLAKHKTPSE